MATESKHGFSGDKTPNGQFPEPIVISPQLDHRQTFILLHGRGTPNSKEFRPSILTLQTTSGEKLQTAFPHAKMIFLTASRTRATIYNRSYTHQWFNGWHIHENHKRQELMRDGLQKSCRYVHGILEREIELIGRENVILWGYSQGCATSLTTLLTWDGEPFAAVVGMCGYLPYANHIEDIAGGKTSDSGVDDLFGQVEDEDDPFSHSDDEFDDKDVLPGDNTIKKDLEAQAIMFVREEIDMENKKGMVFQKVPIFLGNGTEDNKVPIEKGREAKTCLDLVGAEVRMVEYEALGHTISEEFGEILENIFKFLKERLCIKEAQS